MREIANQIIAAHRAAGIPLPSQRNLFELIYMGYNSASAGQEISTGLKNTFANEGRATKETLVSGLQAANLLHPTATTTETAGKIVDDAAAKGPVSSAPGSAIAFAQAPGALMRLGSLGASGGAGKLLLWGVGAVILARAFGQNRKKGKRRRKRNLRWD